MFRSTFGRPGNSGKGEQCQFDYSDSIECNWKERLVEECGVKCLGLGLG